MHAKTSKAVKSTIIDPIYGSQGECNQRDGIKSLASYVEAEELVNITPIVSLALLGLHHFADSFVFGAFL